MAPGAIYQTPDHGGRRLDFAAANASSGGGDSLARFRPNLKGLKWRARLHARAATLRERRSRRKAPIVCVHLSPAPLGLALGAYKAANLTCTKRTMDLTARD